MEFKNLFRLGKDYEILWIMEFVWFMNLIGLYMIYEIKMDRNIYTFACLDL
jgi:hypothetical protein